VPRLSKFIAIWLACGSLWCIALQPTAAPEKRVVFNLRGRVENAAGETVTNARVILLRGDGSTTPARQTRTDSRGEWLFRQVKPGKWKLQALSRDALSEIYQLTIAWRKDQHEVLPVVLQLKVKALEVLAEGKTHLYNHQWKAAQRALEFFALNFTENPMLEEATFWNAYSCFRLARNGQGAASDQDGSAKMRRRALAIIDRLLERYPNGPWSDDARVLQLDIWRDQFRSGTRSDLKPLMNAADPAKEKDSRVRRAAIEVLIPIKPGFAWESLRKEFADTGAAKLRQDLLVLISRFHHSQAAPELERIAEMDPDPLVRAGANYWLKRVKRRQAANSGNRKSADLP